MTLTLEIDEVLGERLHRLAERERVDVSRYATAALTDLAEDEENLALSKDDIASLQRGLADGEAGREIAGSDFLARLQKPLSTK